MIKFKPLTEQAEWSWFKERAVVIWCEDTQGLVAYDDRGIQAMVVLDNWKQDICSVHLCIDNPIAIKRGFIHELFNHAFNVCDRNHVFGSVSASNTKCLRLARHMGFREVARIPDGKGGGVDAVIIRMDKKDCCWISQPVKEEAA